MCQKHDSEKAEKDMNRMNTWRTWLKYGIFHLSRNNEATGILTQLSEQRTGATAANRVSPPDEGKGRTALDIISFAVENKSIEKASFQSSNTITGSITLILVWGGMVCATWYLWAFLCLIYFFPLQKVTTLNELRLFTMHFLHTCSRFTYGNVELDLTIKVPDIVALDPQRNIMRIPHSSQGMTSLSAAIKSH